MSFLTGPMRKHVNGHKDLTDHSEMKFVDPGALVYLPLINMGSTAYEVLVKEGDSVKVGTKVAFRKDHFTVPLYSSVSGTVKGIQKVMHASLKPIEHLVIENDGKYEKEAPLKPLDYKNASKEELVDFMKNMGLVGCGGAGFPAYIKYGAKGIKNLIINAVECEPYLTCDYAGMKENLADLVSGVEAMLKTCEAEKAMVCIKETKKEFIPVLKEAFKDVEKTEVVAVPDVYPMGWERTLVYEVTKQRYDKLPSEVGCIVSNAATAISFAKCMRTGMPIVEKIVTVSGDGVKEPSNVRVPVGTPAGVIINACGGYTSEEILLIAGGPMMGKTITSDKFVIGTYSNALTVLKHVPVKAIACLRCGKCSDHCPAGLQPVRINMAEKSKDTDALKKLGVMDCVECGMCTYICPSKIDVTEGVRRAKRIMALKK
ncbi:MAG: RnfABCDGE type electron transport complex subunit C [Erysipelotrichaceae bacterium]|nr:RnfABCDGE type electron transport complex subunit C [Erysipelotrichaceae bacterium]